MVSVKYTIYSVEYLLKYLFHHDFGVNDLYENATKSLTLFHDTSAAPFNQLHFPSESWQLLLEFIQKYTILKKTETTYKYVLDYQDKQFISDTKYIFCSNSTASFFSKGSPICLRFNSSLCTISKN